LNGLPLNGLPLNSSRIRLELPLATYSNPSPSPALNLSGKRFAVVVSTYHRAITEKLLAGALETLTQSGARGDQIDVLHVPGAWELALGTQAAVNTGRYSGVISLGCVIRGETTHDQYINEFVSQSLGRISLNHNLPIAFGLLTCNTLEQAEARSGGEAGNKGVEAASAMLEMVRFMQMISA
jgi:6,7-dimethyl-8-ribityllumazine synthase